jgi:16S rRNA (cytosine1402-N4)-methyltransferase
MKVVHLPVMLREVIQLLEPHKGEVYVDATVGLGGHAQGILGHMRGEGLLVGIDRDEEALGEAGRILRDERCVLRKARFSEMQDVLKELGIKTIDGVLFDFGASMLHMKQPERGFGFTSGEPLDMRMDRSQSLTAGVIVNTYPAVEVERILREYGEERAARKISGAIVRQRQKGEIRTCRELSEVVARVLGRRGRIHPATRTFQALRIAVNDELNELRKGLEASLGLLRSGGRLVAIAYHSLEDRAVKVFMKDAKDRGLIRVLTKKPVTPGTEEILRNPSARSAKLRAAEVI